MPACGLAQKKRRAGSPRGPGSPRWNYGNTLEANADADGNGRRRRIRRYDVDRGNVAQVLGWCLEQGDAEAGLRICAAVSPCWIVWGTFAEGGEWLCSLLALDMSAVPAWRSRAQADGSV